MKIPSPFLLYFIVFAIAMWLQNVGGIGKQCRMVVLSFVFKQRGHACVNLRWESPFLQEMVDQSQPALKEIGQPDLPGFLFKVDTPSRFMSQKTAQQTAQQQTN